MASTTAVNGLEQLQVSKAVREDIGRFVTQLAQFYGDDLVSVVVFGSAVSGGYSEKTSDINFLVIYSELNIADLKSISELAQEWARKRRFAPRFLSRRNLLDSARYFQIDLMQMRDAHVVLCGEDLLNGIDVHRADMRWQLAHEVKRMRMRIKQQYWRAAGDQALMHRIVLDRFTSLLYLTRALFFLQGKPAPLGTAEIAEAAIRELQIDPEFVHHVQQWKSGEKKADKEDSVEAFTGLMDMIRIVDAAVDGLAE